VLIGLLLLMNSPIVHAAMRDMEATMADRALRQVVVEHPTLMVLAAILVTIGSIVAHAISHDTIQCRTKLIGLAAGKLAIPAAISEVNPDWMMPKTKCE